MSSHLPKMNSHPAVDNKYQNAPIYCSQGFSGVLRNSGHYVDNSLVNPGSQATRQTPCSAELFLSSVNRWIMDRGSCDTAGGFDSELSSITRGVASTNKFPSNQSNLTGWSPCANPCIGINSTGKVSSSMYPNEEFPFESTLLSSIGYSRLGNGQPSSTLYCDNGYSRLKCDGTSSAHPHDVNVLDAGYYCLNPSGKLTLFCWMYLPSCLEQRKMMYQLNHHKAVGCTVLQSLLAVADEYLWLLLKPIKVRY